MVITTEPGSFPFMAVESRRWPVWEVAPPSPDDAAMIFDDCLADLAEPADAWASTRSVMVSRWDGGSKQCDPPRFIQVLLYELKAGYAVDMRADACQRLVSAAGTVAGIYEAR